MLMDATTADRLAVQVTGLFEKHHREIYGYLARLLRDRQLAEDLLQETFLRAFRARSTLGRIQNPRAWLFRIATNLALNALKRRQRLAWLPWSAARQSEGGGRDPGEAVGTRSAVDQALAQLPPQYQSVLILYAHFGLTIAELSEALAISPDAVRTRLHRARELFQSRYAGGERE